MGDRRDYNNKRKRVLALDKTREIGYTIRNMKRVILLLILLTLGGLASADDNQERDVCKDNYDTYKDLLSKHAEDDKTWPVFRACTDLLKRWPEAALVASDALQKKHDLPEAHLILGMAHYHAKEYTQAIDEYKESIRLKNDQAIAYFQMGMSYLYLNQPEEAVKAGVRATELAPTNSAYHRQLAFAYFLTNQNDACEASAKKALEIDPNDVATYKILGNLYQKEGRQAAADHMFEEAIHANGRASAANPFVADKKVVEEPTPNPFTPDTPVSDTEIFLKAQWAKMKETAQTGDIDKTLQFYSDYADTRDAYRQSFQRMGPQRMREVFGKLGDVYDCDVTFAVATCKCPVSAENGTLLETKVRFEKNSDHIWRIKSF
jgi:tetratricopeptide (TPR) repeat protein